MRLRNFLCWVVGSLFLAGPGDKDMLLCQRMWHAGAAASGTGTRLDSVGMRTPASARWRRVAGVAGLVWGLLLVTGCAGGSPAPHPASSLAQCPVGDVQRQAMEAKISAALTEQLALLSDYQLRELRAVLVYVCGVPVHEEYRASTPDDTHNVHSVTKSVVGTLLGIALADGSLKSLDQTLGELLPEDRNVMSPAVARIKLRQLLTMTAGLDADLPDGSVGAWVQSDHFVEGILRQGIVGKPGAFAYSSASSHLLAAILARATRRSVLKYATEKLFRPLGIEMSSAAQPLLVAASAAAYDKAEFAWPVDHQGINYGASFLKLRARDMAKLGQLYLDQGRWQGKQIVTQSWVRQATTGQVDVPGTQGADRYGYQWWVTTAGGHPAYAALGFGGQLVEAVPDKALVVVFATHVDTLANVAQGPSLRFYQDVVSGALVPRLP